MASLNFGSIAPHHIGTTASSQKYGAAPPPLVPTGHVDISAAGTRMPGIYCFAASIARDVPGIAIKRYYYPRDQVDQSYLMTSEGKAEIKPYSSKVITVFVTLLR